MTGSRPTLRGRARVLARLSLATATLACAGPDPGHAGDGAADGPAPPVLADQVSGTDQLLQAVSVVDAAVAWVSGHGGTYARTEDGGGVWAAAVVPGADTLQFRDVHARDARTAWLLAAGPGQLSRIYHTRDGGERWTLQWVNPEADGFYDCLAFWDDRRGLAYGDAVGGVLRILVTGDGGATWETVPADALPPALPGEGGFAASGLCVETRPGGLGWVAAGNTDPARVFLTRDHGRSWTAAEAPVEGGEGAGLMAISMHDDRRGWVFGGSLAEPDTPGRGVARTDDGGRSWVLLGPLPFPGAAYGGLVVPGTGPSAAASPDRAASGPWLIAVGPGGAAASPDGGVEWSQVDDRAWWAAGSAGPDATWLAGPEGRVARVVWPAADR